MTDLMSLLQRQRAAALAEPLPHWVTRQRRLRQLRALLIENRDAIGAAIDADFAGRPREETDLLEIFPSLSGIDYALKHTRRWMKPKRQWANLMFLPARTTLTPQPVGVVGVIVPWNYPLYLAVGPLTDALAAGNRVMLKMSELTPAFSARFAELVSRYFADDEVAVVQGDAEVGKAFSALPFDHLLFTGSTAVGREVMRAAAEHLTPVTLELGGKSPAIVGPGARFDNAVQRIVYGKLVNAGQTCIAPDYALVPRERVDEFVQQATAAITASYPDLRNNSQYASIISSRHRERLAAVLDDAKQQGATIHTVATVRDAAFAPTLVTGVSDSMRIMREELFGPLLPVVAYDTLDEAIAYINRHDRPLALYVFDDNDTNVRNVLERTHAGGVTVNDTLFHIAQHHLPFGGIGPSGMGSYHGEAGFQRFSHRKPVLRQARLNGAKMLAPPYGRLFKNLASRLLR
ncbi:coniferyl-aldehyde dehydrogenase [Luteibacter sp. Sphag1AF]|uniref:coniferyl aldehyde dehydrogenase n=1 Tax=Luteibacter sp. Sphag1AF TaxID=2587031 RepID=UPI0017D8F275|nr:coniferyl aldehyde dehydrogenase [Luteibacter sp. Sphag1AF]MBB3226202.1 coniferyl-aldehyde dehydrogenase [Luteibacter sp. Sphag1AF]